MKSKKKTALKHYRVIVTGQASVVVVDAKNEKHALTLAREEVRNNILQIATAVISKQLTEDELGDAKAKADLVSAP
jgi:hypothetical protein